MVRRVRPWAGGWAAVKRKNEKMNELISETFQAARKEYNCMACEWLFNNLADYWDEMTYSEKKAAVRAAQNKERILPGQKYVRQFVRDGGDVYTYRAIPDIHAICLRLIYPHID